MPIEKELTHDCVRLLGARMSYQCVGGYVLNLTSCFHVQLSLLRFLCSEFCSFFFFFFLVVQPQIPNFWEKKSVLLCVCPWACFICLKMFTPDGRYTRRSFFVLSLSVTVLTGDFFPSLNTFSHFYCVSREAFVENLPFECSIQRFLFVILQCVETVPDVDRASTHVCFYCCT